MKDKRFIYSLEEIPLFVDVPYLCKIFQRTPTTIRAKCKTGKIKAVKDGSSWLVPKTEIIRLYEEGGIL